MSQVVRVDSPQEFSTILSSSRIVVVNFYSEQNTASKATAPVYDALSQQLSRAGAITFARIDVEAQQHIVQTYGVTMTPTFMIFKSGQETKRIKGADVKGLDAAIKSLAQEASSSTEGDASASSSSGKSWLGSTIPRGYGDVTDQVDQLGLDFLNIDGAAGGARTVFDPSQPSALNQKGKQASSKDWIESDTDEQLMLFIPFQSTMKLHSLHITSLANSASEDEETDRPKTIRLYTNRTTVLGFDEADDVVSTQALEIQESDWDKKTGTARIELRFVKFQNISSLVIFVVDGVRDAGKTRIDRIRLLGESGEKKTMGKLEKIGNEQGE